MTNIVLIVLLIVAGVTGILIGGALRKEHTLTDEERAEISIRESIYYTKMPLLPIELENNQRVNFILDSASNVSHINEEDLKFFKYESTAQTQSIMGIEGNLQDVDKVILKFSYKNNNFEAEACKSDLSKTFNNFSAEIKRLYGTDIKVVGLLGNDFLTKYGYVLDFNDLIVYKKKKTKK